MATGWSMFVHAVSLTAVGASFAGVTVIAAVAPSHVPQGSQAS